MASIGYTIVKSQHLGLYLSEDYEYRFSRKGVVMKQCVFVEFLNT